MAANPKTKPTTKPPKRPRAAARPAFDPERRATILRAALRVFANKGFHRTTIREIAQEAELAQGTLYNHFENKTALITGLIEALQQQGQESASLSPNDQSAPHHDLPRFLPMHFKQMLDMHAAEGKNVLGVLLAEMLTDPQLRQAHATTLFAPVFETGAQAMKQWTKQGLIRKTRPEITTRLIGAMLLGVQIQQMLGDPMIDQYWDELPSAMASLVLRGIENKQEHKDK